MRIIIAAALVTLTAIIGLTCGGASPTPVPTETPPPVATPAAVPTSTPAPVVTASPAPAATPGSTATSMPTDTPVPTAATGPTSTETPAPQQSLTPAQIFARVSPSIAFIQTPIGNGSGVLIDGGYVVTNAHVVWPFQEARIVFPDGTQHLDTQVANWDFMGDLAVLGPIETSISPLEFVDGEDTIIGSDLFLIGYPAEVERFPQPAITRGILSRLRQWEAMEITYFQTDAVSAGGQSGGVLVSEKAEVIGLSGFFLSEARFGVVASAADVLPRIQMLIADRDVAQLGDRRIPSGGGSREHTFDLKAGPGNRTFVINEPVGTTIEVEVQSDNDAAFALVDVLGNILALVDESFRGLEAASVLTGLDAPLFLIIFEASDEGGTFRLSSNVNLMPYQDKDDSGNLAVGETVPGNLDHPGDIDFYSIWLSEGDVIEATVDTVNFDAFGMIAFAGARDDEIAFDDDSGEGIFGTNAKVTYRAPHTGNYSIVVRDIDGTALGGYLVTVSKAPNDATLSSTFPAPDSTATEGFDLPSLLPSLADLPAGVALENEGYTSETKYERSFEAVGGTFELGSSQIIQIKTEAELYPTASAALDILSIVKGLDPSALGEIFARDLSAGDFPEIIGTREDIQFETLAVLPIGDATGGWFFRLSATGGSFEGFLIFFAEDRVVAFVTVTGPAGQIHLEDIVPLGRMIAERIRGSSPSIEDQGELGRFYRGNTLRISVVAIERAEELRYATVDAEDVARHWRIVSSGSGQELILVRLKVQSHTTISAVLDVDQQAVELRDFARGTYFPLNLGTRLFQDLRDQRDVTVRMGQGQCFDPNRMYITEGTTVKWVNEGASVHFVQIDPADTNLSPIIPGETFIHTFGGPETLDYKCSAEEILPQTAQIVVEPASTEAPVKERFMVFIDGPFELLRDMGIDGWLVFEAPVGTDFRDLWWRAGDSITVPLEGIELSTSSTNSAIE